MEIAFQRNSTPENQTEIIIFCGLVHLSRTYENRYEIDSTDEILVSELEDFDAEDRKNLFFSFLAFQDQVEIRRVFYQLSESGQLVFKCENCKNEIYLLVEDDKIAVYKEQTVFNKNAQKFELSPIEIDWNNWNGEYSDEQKAKWMMYLTVKYKIESLKNQISYLFSDLSSLRSFHKYYEQLG